MRTHCKTYNKNNDNNNNYHNAMVLRTTTTTTTTRFKRKTSSSNQTTTPKATTTTMERTRNKRILTENRRFTLVGNWQQICIKLTPLLLLVLATTTAVVECQQVSQISPKSSSHLEGGNDDHAASHLRTSVFSLESTAPDLELDLLDTTHHQSQREENETRRHQRVERSALPIVNSESFPKSGPNDVHLAGPEGQKQAAAGRYFQYNIKPTGTYDAHPAEGPERTDGGRSAKSLASSSSTSTMTGSFLSKGGLRPPTSGSPISPTTTTSSSATSAAAVTATAAPHSGRQNPNPDIQDIITGIVKLLNGNVNVHANTQGVRRPSASRINNRGPPRISDVQSLPLDYDMQKPPLGSSIRPPPYPFDRPERPFITGVPIPEQIVPYRPGFVSQRPPWHRNKPRPPISGGGRRPIPQYKPLPASHMGGPSQEMEAPMPEQRPPMPPSPASSQPPRAPDAGNVDFAHDYNDTLEPARPTDTSYDSEFSNEDTNAQYIEVSDHDDHVVNHNSNNNNHNHNHEHDSDAAASGSATGSDNDNGDDDNLEDDFRPSSTPSPPPLPPPQSSSSSSSGSSPSSGSSSSSSSSGSSSSSSSKKGDSKKKPSKHKTSEKKKPQPSSGDEYTTIFDMSSAVNQAEASTYLPMPMAGFGDGVDIDPSTDEVIFMTTSRTPSLPGDGGNPSETTHPGFSFSSTTTITTTPFLTAGETNVDEIMKESNLGSISSSSNSDLRSTIQPTPSSSVPTTPTTTTTPTPPPNYQPRPGIVLDDPEFKPGGRPRPHAHAPGQRPNLPHQPPQPRPPPPPPHQHHQHIQPTRQHLPPGYGEIFDVTLSAIQGPGSGGGSQQTINIKPYGSYGGGGGHQHQQHQQQQQGDIIVSAAGDEGFVSIDGKRTYINLFGDPTDPPAGVQQPTTPATAVPQLPGSGSTGGDGSGGGNGGGGVGGGGPSLGHGTGYAVPETEVVALQPTKSHSPKPAGASGTSSHAPSSPTTTNAGPTRPHYRPRTTQPPVRIDTCIVGDDSTCDQAQHERCRTENGVSSCHCRPGYSRRKHREPCRKVISFFLGLRVDRIYEHRIVWDKKLLDRSSEPYGQLSYESIRAIDSAMSMTPYSDEFMEAKVNNIYRGDPKLGGSGVFVNMTIKLDESVETLRPNLRSDVQKHLLGVIHRRNNNIGNSVLYVTSPEGSISSLHDLDECRSEELNDCHPNAVCTNSWGSFRCVCETGLRDPWADQPQRAGRECQACPDAYCNNRGTCSYNEEGAQVCACDSSHYGGQCEIDGEVLGVAIGASVAAVIIIVLTLVCLIMWSRRWQREQKNAMGSPVFGYMNTAPLKSAAAAGLTQPGYQVTLEDRMRWAQIADVMAQTNHYGAEPIGPTRPSSAMFAYPNLQAMGMGTIGGMSLQSTMQMHQNANLPPVPLPRRLGLGSRSNGMRTLENSSSSEEEDRADLLGRNFQVPRPKSRSNGSIANQSGIYYDVDYEPSGNGIGNTSVDHLYGSQNQSSSHSHAHSHSHSGNNHIPGPQGIPMSTYTSGRAPSSYYMK